MVEHRCYDAADRLTDIQVHGPGAGTPLLLRVQYTWNLDNTVATRTETNTAAGKTSTTTYTYDDLQRLVEEARVGDNPYDFFYAYDPGGNRTFKGDNITGDYTYYIYDNQYFYDGSYPDPDYPTFANRLVSYQEYGPTIGSSSSFVASSVLRPLSGDCMTTAPMNLKRTVWYTYWQSGQVSNITVKDAGDPWYRDLALYYQTNDLLYMALWDEWKTSGTGCAVSNYTSMRALEFRFGNDPRERYMTRELSVKPGDRFLKPKRWKMAGSPMPHQVEAELTDDAFVEANWCTSLTPGTPMDDFTLTMDVGAGNGDIGVFNADRSGLNARHVGTLADVDPSSGDPEDEDSTPEYTRYNHCDMTGSVLLQTDDLGEPAGGSSTTASYTAFGEPAYAGALDDFESRYRYCGEFGYESGVQTDLPEGDEWASYFGAMGGMLRLAGASGTQPIDLVHVGYRWYQPNIGRFIQRDPLGIQGGLNVYVYCADDPSQSVDPFGLWRVFDYVNFSFSIPIPTPWTGPFLGVSGSVSLDRNGRMYFGPGICAGFPSALSAGLTANWLNGCVTPTPKQLQNFLSASSFDLSGGMGLGGRFAYTPGSGTSTGIGIMTPGVSGGYTYSFVGPLLPVHW